ncbi:MAG: SagB/ThcOx family dehydrogenase [Calditrichia bacterium]
MQTKTSLTESADFSLKALLSTSGKCHSWLNKSSLQQSPWERFQQQQVDFYDPAELYHENSKLRRCFSTKDGQGIRFFLADPQMIDGTSQINKTYPGSNKITLPGVRLKRKSSIDETIRSRRSCRSFNGEAASLKELSNILHLSNGVTGQSKSTIEGQKEIVQHYRAAPSAGSLYSTEMYVAVFSVETLTPGIYHYNVLGHQLEELDLSQHFTAAFPDCFPIHPDTFQVDKCAFLLILSSVFQRSTAKYGSRGYRLALQESGHIMQNALLIATAQNIGTLPVAGYYDDELNSWLKLDGVTESVVYVAGFGSAESFCG